MKMKQIRDLSPAELQKQIDESHQELFNLRFQLSTGKAKNYKRVGQVKKTIARLKTLDNERAGELA
jgi:large subunit ribosomal protein L29